MIARVGTDTACAYDTCQTAPAGGADLRWCRGCFSAAIIFVANSAGSTVAMDTIAVPSGQDVTLQEVLIDEQLGAPLVRFRFLAPAIARETGSVAPAAAAQDMDHLCDTFAVPYLETFGLTVDRVVISFADQDTPFGASNPLATQFFEAYSVSEGGCMWEEF